MAKSKKVRTWFVIAFCLSLTAIFAVEGCGKSTPVTSATIYGGMK
jgi:hypothetical protein